MGQAYKHMDIWRTHIPKPKLKAYKALLDSGTIKDPHVKYYRKQQITTVEYSSDLTHDQVKQLLREAVDA